MKRFVIRLTAFSFLMSVSWAAQVRYRIEARIDPALHRIEASQGIEFENNTSRPLEDILLFLYPNQFQQKNPHLNEINYFWHYPSGFNQGWLRVDRVMESGHPLQFTVTQGEGLPADSLLHVVLPEPLPPGEALSLQLHFECQIPEKYGPFGHYHQTLTLQGGWYPYLVPLDSAGNPLLKALPPPARFQTSLSLTTPRDVVLNGKFFPSTQEVQTTELNARALSLVIAPHLYRESREAGGRKLHYYSPLKDRYDRAGLLDALQDALEEAGRFFSQSPRREVTVVETYLRAVMTYPAEDMVFISDRSFYTVPKFDLLNLNRLELARAVTYLLIDEEVVGREGPMDSNWVAEGLAWYFGNLYAEEHFQQLSNLRETASEMGMFRPFNRMAASPTIPFSETYVGQNVSRDTFRESLFYYNNALPSGWLFFDKLLSIVGKDVLDAAVRSYLRGSQDFRSQVEELSGQDLDWFFQQWSEGYPEDLDYRLVDVQLNQHWGDQFRSSFRVEKLTRSAHVEPIAVAVSTKDGKQILTWDGRGKEKRFELSTESKIVRIEIDPSHRSAELRDDNNLAPKPWEMVMDRGDFSASTGGFGAATRIRLHRARDFGKWMFVSPFFSPALYGVETGMILNFGPSVGGLVYKKLHEMSLSYVWTGLRGDFAQPQSGRLDTRGQTAGIRFRYAVSNEKFEEDPQSYQQIGLTMNLYRTELGSDFNFFQALLEARKVYAIHPHHKLAGRLILGYSDGFRQQDQVPTQNLFDLSSAGNLGTLKSGRHLGENILSTTFEWRHDLLTDMDAKLPMNWVRRIQGVLAFEAGWVAPQFDRLFRLNDTIYGIRYGLRFHYDFLGIRPSDVTFDVGRRIGSSRSDGLVISFGILQWF